MGIVNLCVTALAGSWQLASQRNNVSPFELSPVPFCVAPESTTVTVTSSSESDDDDDDDVNDDARECDARNDDDDEVEADDVGTRRVGENELSSNDERGFDPVATERNVGVLESPSSIAGLSLQSPTVEPSRQQLNNHFADNRRRRSEDVSVDSARAPTGRRLDVGGGSSAGDRRRSGGEEVLRMQAELLELTEAARCPVCLDRRKKLVFTCGHACCQLCGDTVQQCPICRLPVERRILLF